MQLTWLEAPLSVCRLSSEEAVPAWATQPGAFFCAVRTPGELSLVGVLSSLLTPITQARISVFVMSTFDTDYVLVPAEAQDQATLALVAAGHEVGQATPGMPGRSSSLGTDRRP